MQERRRKPRRVEDVKKDEVIAEVVHPNPAMRPARRIWVAVLFFCICIAIGLSYFGIQRWTSSIQKSACNRANDVRQESNARIGSHVTDELNLLALLKAITHTREVEATAWLNLNNLIVKATPKNKQHTTTFEKYEANIHQLITAYQLARTRDASIERSESTIHYDKLNIVNCKKVA